VEKIACAVTLKRGRGTVKLTALDEHGYPTSKRTTIRRNGDAVTLRLAPDAVYHVVERAAATSPGAGSPTQPE
jgi:hypothetical protein